MSILHDLRYGARLLVKRPALAGITVLTLGLGIGLTTLMFSLVNTAMIKGLPFEEPDRLAACVFAEPDPEWGEVVCAALVARADLDLDFIRREIARTLAPFKRPRRVGLVGAIPMGPSGKPDRQATARLTTPRLRPL